MMFGLARRLLLLIFPLAASAAMFGKLAYSPSSSRATELVSQRSLEMSLSHPRVLESDASIVAEVAPSSDRNDDSGGYLGVVLARNSSDIAPRFDGRLATVNVRVGDRVKQGMVVATLALSTLQYDVRAAEAEEMVAELGVESASTEVSQAEERAERKRRLGGASLATGEDVAAANYQARLAKNRVLGARATATARRAQLERLRRDVKDTEIVAPFDGVVAARYADPGATVRSGSPVVRLITQDDLLTRFAVPPSATSAVAIGSRVTIRTNESHQVLSAIVERISTEVEPASHMVFVEARVDARATGDNLLSGEFARVVAERGRAKRP